MTGKQKKYNELVVNYALDLESYFDFLLLSRRTKTINAQAIPNILVNFLVSYMYKSARSMNLSKDEFLESMSAVNEHINLLCQDITKTYTYSWNENDKN